MLNQLIQNQLDGHNIQLKSLKPKHKKELIAIAQNELIWRFNQPVNMPLKSFIDSYIDSMFSSHQNDSFVYVVLNNNQIIGSTRFYEASEKDKRLCIGFTWYCPTVWGTHVNPEAKYLLLNHAFKDLHMNRVGFHVDSRNARSISAMLRLGANLEGVMKQHKIVQKNVVRDTVLFGIVKEDWPAIKVKLTNRFK